MTGHLFEPRFSIVKLDKAGGGEVVRVSFQPSKSENCIARPRTPMLQLFFYHNITKVQVKVLITTIAPLQIYSKVL